MSGLLERDELLARLRDEGVAAEQRGRAVFLGGEAGAGKTAVARAVAEGRVGVPPAPFGSCDALDTPRP